MGIVRKVLEWVDKIMDKSYRDDNAPRAMCEAVCAGAIEGALDGLVILGAVSVATSIICKDSTKTK